VSPELVPLLILGALLAVAIARLIYKLGWGRLKRAWSSFLAWVERGLSRPYRSRMALYATEKAILKRPELEYVPPSRRLVYATAFCFVALAALSAALILCIALLGRVPTELTTAIVSLASTIAGIYIGRRGGDLGGYTGN